MCGIWGFRSYYGKPNREILSKIIALADSRGGHSNGFYSIDQKGFHTLYKKHGKAKVNQILGLLKDSEVAIGHSRLATNNDISIFNSQPILVNSIVLVHNGIIENHKDIYKKLSYEPKTDNDSEALHLLIQQDKLPEKYAYMLIRFNDVGHEFESGNKDLPLFCKDVNGVVYYCSNEF